MRYRRAASVEAAELILFDRSTVLRNDPPYSGRSDGSPRIRQPASECGSERRIIDSREANVVLRLRNCVDARALHEGLRLEAVEEGNDGGREEENPAGTPSSLFSSTTLSYQWRI